MKKFNAFTLAEVLITIGIIGIVAEITIPTLITNFQTQVYKTAYKKSYSIASQAVVTASNDGSFVSRSGWTDAADNTTNWQAFKTKFLIAKDCDGTIVPLSSCWDTTGEQFNGSSAPVATDPGFIDNSGMTWVQGSSGGVGVIATGDVFVDTNGFKGPNKFGQDRFRLAFWPPGGFNAAGTPLRVAADSDYPTYNVNFCKYPPCYYTSWLFN